MRIAHVHWTAPPVVGGVEAHCESLVLQLSHRGVDVVFFTGVRQASGAPYRELLDLRAPAPNPTAVGEFAEELRAFDVVHWHNPQWHRPGVARQVADRLRDTAGPKLVLDLHNLSEDAAHWAFLRDVPCSRFLVHSPFVRDQVGMHLPDRACDLAPLALERVPTTSALQGIPGPVVLQPTRLNRWKGSHLSLTAAATLLAEGMDFTFVHAGAGDAVWPAQLDDVLDDVSKWIDAGRIRLISYRWQQSWASIGSADLVVHPTTDIGAHGEPFSLSAAQAVVCSRPLVVSDSGNLPDLLSEYEPKRVVPVDDGEALTTAMRDLLLAPAQDAPPAARELGHRLAHSLATSGVWHEGWYGRLMGASA
jgi:glycosyltransferase involved in cell wall biosynthesis